jgi:hypothetical protein
MATPAQIAADRRSACRPRACDAGVRALETQVLSKRSRASCCAKGLGLVGFLEKRQKPAKNVKNHLRSGGIEEKSRIAGTCRDEEKRHDPTEQEPLQLRRIVPHALRGRGASAGIAG